MNKTRTAIEILVIVLLVPAALFLSLKLGDRLYYLSSVIVMLLMMVPFFMRFEHRAPSARELVTLAVMAAICAAGRIAFVMVPYFSAMTGLIMITGLAMGPEFGFLVGSLAAFASNFIYGQGPWTPWQMFAYGLAGCLAGLLAKKGIMAAEKRIPTAIIGGLIVFCIVGPLLDTAAVFLSMTELNGASVLTVYAAGVPVNAIHAACTVVTILLLVKPIEEKLARIKTKYGLME